MVTADETPELVRLVVAWYGQDQYLRPRRVWVWIGTTSGLAYLQGARSEIHDRAKSTTSSGP